MRASARRPWHLYALALVGAGLLAAGVTEIGPPASSARTSSQIVTAAKGIVQSTVSGTGNVEPGTDAEANFKTGGTLSQVHVKVGQHVSEGQLLATLDPTSAQLSVDQAQLGVTSAEDQLTALQDGTSSSAGSSGTSGSASNANTTLDPAATEFVTDTTTTTTTTTTTPTGTTTPTTTTKPTSTKKPTSTNKPSTAPKPTTSRPSTTTKSAGTGRSASSSSSTTTPTPPSPASIASAQASVDSAELALRSAQDALAETRLYAPASGTVVSLQSTTPGDVISAGSGSGSSSSGSTGSGASGSTGSGSSGSTGSGSTATSSAGSLGSSSSSSSSSSSGFAEIVNTGTMTMTVAFSESDITKVKVGQPATVTLDALSGVELAAHVSAISTLGTTSSGVVSYDATLTLDQNDSRVRPGMSASAAVVTSQAQGVTLPNSAVTGSGSLSTVNVLRSGKTVSTPVVVGLKGDSRTQIVSGLNAGAQVVVTTTLPALSSTATSGASSSGTLGGGGRFGGGGGFGGGGFRLGGGAGG